MSETVTVPNLIMMVVIVSDESLVRDRHTDTDSVSVIFLKFCFVWKQKALNIFPFQSQLHITNTHEQ